ncbi:transposase [Pontibacter sp. SGAir0037]|uniref:transposase n=1 Tax=Pontibacter sp. SGAir0037 TaxID=2571030 RepID=UPI0010CD5BD9|nr:transposase [Pontibacter sp. SGAir0037]QCR22521.1 hypothetical protein C1N53_09355 [Pontibacter sp. SGAir0037]
MAHPERKRNRLSGYDYSSEGLYFVTSCVQDRVHAFGEVVEGEMRLNRFGLIAEQQWYWLHERYPNVVLHEFVVMPNHIHGIIQLDNSTTSTPLSEKGPVPPGAIGRPEHGLTTLTSPGSKPKSISGIMGAYKTTSSKLIRQAGMPEFAWQRSFHDHIIRNNIAYNNIADYILNNPSLWHKDKFHI